MRTELRYFIILYKGHIEINIVIQSVFGLQIRTFWLDNHDICDFKLFSLPGSVHNETISIEVSQLSTLYQL